MFFPNRIQNIRARDKVLEVGPGSTPHSRSNEFLEYDFNHDDLVRQRGGGSDALNLAGRKLTCYSGARMPYGDGVFDYVIASHVIEHVEDPIEFVRELCRIGGGRGYIEFPLPIYEYLYDFDVHRHYVWFDHALGAVKYFPKDATNHQMFAGMTDGLRQSLAAGWDDLIASNPEIFFYGFEFSQEIKILRAQCLSEYRAPEFPIKKQSPWRRLILNSVSKGLNFLIKAKRAK